ncbi:subtilisin-like protease SBT4.3 [Lotus japonicus]|uniref:subtilisin-like protease SBT4.3 n=1 Tax=Lotus japonicus TaxID=34305 RepID=UPI0025853EA8|nr:subtilisin-like protease SBT4.3 [Lotus japonicus]
MGKHSFLLILLPFVLTHTIPLVCEASKDDIQDHKLYIIYMGSLPDERDSSNYYSPTSHHVSMLQQVVGARDVRRHHVRSYKRSFNGFAAKLSEKQREIIVGMDGVVSVFPSETLQIQTTRSWDFLGFHESVKRQHKKESDLVIGVIDTGIWPESDIFNFSGVGPIPANWKGHCKGGANFTCNNKIIGARVYGLAQGTVRDTIGHGTHAASIAAGNIVTGASFYGLAQGTARGAVPSARIAAYKTCSSKGCPADNVLAAFDDAIADGVNIISISLAGYKAVDFVNDPIAIGSFHAMEKGILTVQAVGNSGPVSRSVISVAPWLLSVAASTIDRQFIDKVILGNEMTLIGRSVNGVVSNGTKFPIVKQNASDDKCKKFSDVCECLGREQVKGKIVLCGGIAKDIAAFDNGAVGSITTDINFPDNDVLSLVTYLPSMNLNSKDYAIVQNYTNSANNPEAEILKSEISEDRSAPKVIFFSSRGPNPLIPEILKPDVSAPGVDILAAWSPEATPSEYSSDKRKVNYNVLYGTSMACPHVAGVAAYLKSFHPNWSRAAIKSAIMTTADPFNGNYNLTGEFSYGAGNVNPVKATNPGLVYDISKKDYVKMLCNYGYSAKKVKIIAGAHSASCHGVAHDRTLVKDLNYPAITVNVEPLEPYIIKFNRIVTNVGFPHNSTYKAIVSPNPKMNITVEPKVLRFKSLHEKHSFVVTVAGGGLQRGSAVSSSLVWSDGKHNVKSPIIVFVS